MVGRGLTYFLRVALFLTKKELDPRVLALVFLISRVVELVSLSKTLP